MNDVKLFLKDLSANEITQITALAVRQISSEDFDPFLDSNSQTER